MGIKEQQNGIRATAFESLSPRDLQTFFWHFHEMEISHGCGGRPCKMCCYAAPTLQESHLPFTAIQHIHTLKAQYAPHVPYWLHRANDPLYYQDAISGGMWDIADVVRDAHVKGLRPTISTHGFVPGEQVPEQAAMKLVQLARQDKTIPKILLSIDPLGFIGHSRKQQVEIIAYSLDILHPIIAGINAFYVPQDKGSMDALEELIRSAVPTDLQDTIHRRPVLGFGRAINQTGLRESRLVTQPSSLGYTIRHDGSVEFNAYTDAVPQNIGSISTGLKVPFNTPAPDAPSFSEFDF